MPLSLLNGHVRTSILLEAQVRYQMENVSLAKLKHRRDIVLYSSLDLRRFARRSSFADVIKIVMGSSTIAMLCEGFNNAVSAGVAKGEITTMRCVKRELSDGTSHEYTVEEHYKTKTLAEDEFLDWYAHYLASETGELGDMGRDRFNWIRAHLCVIDLDAWITNINANLTSLISVFGVVCIDDVLWHWLGKSDVTVFIPKKPAVVGIFGDAAAVKLRCTDCPFIFSFLAHSKPREKLSPGDAALSIARGVPPPSCFVLDAGYGTWDLVRSMKNIGHDTLMSFSSGNIGAVGSLLSAGLERACYRVARARVDGADVVVHCLCPAKGKRLVLTVGTNYVVDHQAVPVHEPPLLEQFTVWRAVDVKALAGLPKPCLIDLAARLNVDPTGDASTLAYRISGRSELSSRSSADVASSLPESTTATRARETDDHIEDKVVRVPRHRRVLTELRVGDVINVYFNDKKEWEQGVVKRTDKSWVDPYCVEFAHDTGEFWIKLDEKVKLLDERGRVVACTRDLYDAAGDGGDAGPAVNAANYATLPADQLRIALDGKTTLQLHEMLLEIHCPPKPKWNKEDMIRAFIKHRNDDLRSERDPARRLASFLEPTATEGCCLLSQDYRSWMGLVDRHDQAQERAFPNQRIYGGHERAFVFHLLTVLFVNARAAHLDLHGSAADVRPQSVKDYITMFVQSRREPGQN